ncbi:MAG: exodeoxyribonuclease V subunit gamma [Lachnospiraceae bacterium]|nr:exodeoxyribonuclease V subunit gamma [Lachnospiraceae bacterium]
MSMQLIVGPSGAGKSHYIYDLIIKESMENPNTNYILLVPEQYSMALQRKMVMLHPAGGTLNIDVIGFNRLAYRVFDELNVKTAKVLEDFGKSMLVRRVAGELKDKLRVYQNCLNKNGFIDEVKSLMSEFYQYDFSVEELNNVINSLEKSGDTSALIDKLKDMEAIISSFQEKISDEYIVAEQLTELLYDYVPKSQLIKKSVIVMDGFTGFTPIQLKLIGSLLSCAKKVYSIHTIDEDSYNKSLNGKLQEHELFYLTFKTLSSLRNLAEERKVSIESDITLGFECPKRWSEDKRDLLHLQRYIFRYPYKMYRDEVENIFINSYQTPRRQLRGVCETIFTLVKDKGFRYKDIAIISGSFDKNISAISQIFPQYDIPYFLDYARPVKNNPCVDAIGHALRIIQEDFSYDSVFSFLKAELIDEISTDDIEELENYCLAKGIKGYRRWNREWKNTDLVAKDSFMEIIKPFYRAFKKKNGTVGDYSKAVVELMDFLGYEEKLKETKGLYDKLISIFDKLENIMGQDIVTVREFNEIVDVGFKELSLGIIPTNLDMVMVGDITRTRLDGVKVLFIIDVNEGIIPKTGSKTGIISEREKEKLLAMGAQLAPTDKENSFVEQMYLYSIMATPSHKLYISYTNMTSDNKPISPSYLIGRVESLFENLHCNADKSQAVTTPKATREKLIDGMLRRKWGGASEIDQTTRAIYQAYNNADTKVEISEIVDAMNYSNVPSKLSDKVTELIRLRMMKQSISKLEQYAQCGYSYFLKYTLGLKERELFEVDSRETGNILHHAMEGIFRHVHDNLGNDWSSVPDSERDVMVERFVDEAWLNELDGRDIEGGRYQQLKESLYRIGKRTIRTLNDINDKAVLKPEYFEYRFNHNMDIDGDNSMTISGVVDRGDVAYDEVDDKLTLRIIDYKSGNQDFEMNKLYAGMQLQLAIYTNIMIELAQGKGKLDVVSENTQITPEGMYYYRMKDPYVEISKEEELEAKRIKELELKGFANKDDETFNTVLKYADMKARQLAGEITHGEIPKKPFSDGRIKSCDYCPYSDCCRFDDKYGGNSYQRLKFSNAKNKQPIIVDKMREELQKDKKKGEVAAEDE